MRNTLKWQAHIEFADGKPVQLRGNAAAGGRLMHDERGPYVAEPRPSGKSSLTDPHRVQLALDMAAPKLEKPAQLGKVRGDIELLPDETLQQVGVIGEVVDDLRGRQPAFAEL